MQFANPYYLETKDATTNESARIIFVLMTFGAIILMLAVSPLTALYIHPVIARLIARNKTNVEPTNEPGKDYHYNKMIH